MNKKQFTLNFIFQALYLIVNLGISFFLVPYIVANINATANGFVSLSNDFVNYAQIITVALNSMAGRYITVALHKKDYKKANEYFNSVFIANLFISIIVAILATILIIFADKILNVPTNLLLDVRILFAFVFTNFILSILTSTFSVATFTTNKLYISSIISTSSQIARVIVMFLMFKFLDPSIWYIGAGALTATGITSLVSLIYLKKLTPELKFNKKYYHFKSVIELVKSGIWNSISKLSSIISNGLDLLITNIFVSSAAMGTMSIPKSVHSIVLTIFGSLATVFAPKITMSFAHNDNNEIKKDLKFSMKFLGVFSNICLTCLFVYIFSFFKLWVPGQDATVLTIIAITSCMAAVFSLILEPCYNLFTAYNKIKLPALVGIATSFLTIILVFIGLYITDDTTIKLIIISSTSSLVGLFRVLFFLPIYSSYLLHEKKTYFYPTIIKNTLALLSSIIISLILSKIIPSNTWITLIISLIISCISTFIITYIINFTKEERQTFNKTFFGKIIKKGA